MGFIDQLVTGGDWSPVVNEQLAGVHGGYTLCTGWKLVYNGLSVVDGFNGLYHQL